MLNASLRDILLLVLAAALIGIGLGYVSALLAP